MAINVYATEGLFTSAAEEQAISELTTSFLKQLGLSGNKFVTPTVIGEMNVIPKGRSFLGGKPNDHVIVELKVPSFAFTTPEQKQGFVFEATEIVNRATNGKLPKEHIFVNMVYTVDGLWGIGGQTFTNSQLGEAAQKAAAN